jgi:ABC-2 type transport system permease protein
MQANPVIVKELRGRMRGWRAGVVLTIYLTILAVVTLLFYWPLSTSVQAGFQQASQIGKWLLTAIVIFQLIMIFIITPAFTAGAITGEREQRTYDLLVTTLLTPRSIIFGKLGSALAYVALLILAVAPLESLSFMFGGVSPEEIVLSQVVMFVTAFLFCSMGIFWSTVVRSSVASNVLTYSTILFQLLAIPLLYLTITSTMQIYSAPPGGTPFSQTPAFIYISGVVLSSNPLIAMGLSDFFLSQGKSLFVYSDTTILNGHDLLVMSPWLVYCLEALLVSAVLVLVSIRQVRPVNYRSRAVSAPVGNSDGTPRSPGSPPPPSTEPDAASPPGASNADLSARVSTTPGVSPFMQPSISNLPAPPGILPPPPPPPTRAQPATQESAGEGPPPEQRQEGRG